MTDDFNARDVIIELRGGVPVKCDFCLTETLHEKLHPEEGGEWVCEKCLEHWDREIDGAKK